MTAGPVERKSSADLAAERAAVVRDLLERGDERLLSIDGSLEGIPADLTRKERLACDRAAYLLATESVPRLADALTEAQQEVERLRTGWRELERGASLALSNGFDRVDVRDLLAAIAKGGFTGAAPVVSMGAVALDVANRVQ